MRENLYGEPDPLSPVSASTMVDKLKLIRRLNIGVAGAISGVYLYGKCMTVENLKQKLELRVDDKIYPVPESLKSLLDEVKSEIKQDYVQKGRYNLFISKGVDLTHFGLPNLFNGTYFGVPYNFLIEKDSDVDLAALMDGNQPLTDPEKLQTLKNSMCLSKEAKKFALANELFKCHHTVVIPCGVLPLLVILNCSFLSYLVQKLTIRQRNPVTLRVHIVIYLIGAWFYGLFYDVFSVTKEVDSDYLTGQLGSSYVQGGVEYYEKMLQRNKILKIIQKSSTFTEDGDIKKSIFRTMHVSLARRLAYFKDFKNERINPWSLMT